MKKKGFMKKLKETYGYGLVALGVYNVILLISYFKNGRDISVLPPKAEMFLTDIVLVAVTVLIVMLLDSRHPDSSGSEE